VETFDPFARFSTFPDEAYTCINVRSLHISLSHGHYQLHSDQAKGGSGMLSESLTASPQSAADRNVLVIRSLHQCSFWSTTLLDWTRRREGLAVPSMRVIPSVCVYPSSRLIAVAHAASESALSLGYQWVPVFADLGHPAHFAVSCGVLLDIFCPMITSTSYSASSHEQLSDIIRQ
jgi:hypothetical protein